MYLCITFQNYFTPNKLDWKFNIVSKPTDMHKLLLNVWPRLNIRDPELLSIVLIMCKCADSLLAGAPGVLSSPFMHSLASPLTAPYAGGVASAIPGLGGFALGQTAPGLRSLTAPGLPLATVLLVSNLNEEVSITRTDDVKFRTIFYSANIFRICMYSLRTNYFIINKSLIIINKGHFHF